MSMYADPADTKHVSGFKLVFSSDCDDGRADVDHVLGTFRPGYTEYSQTITKKLVSVDVCFNNVDYYLEDIQLNFMDYSQT